MSSLAFMRPPFRFPWCWAFQVKVGQEHEEEPIPAIVRNTKLCVYAPFSILPQVFVRDSPSRTPCDWWLNCMKYSKQPDFSLNDLFFGAAGWCDRELTASMSQRICRRIRNRRRSSDHACKLHFQFLERFCQSRLYFFAVNFWLNLVIVFLPKVVKRTTFTVDPNRPAIGVRCHQSGRCQTWWIE